MTGTVSERGVVLVLVLAPVDEVFERRLEGVLLHVLLEEVLVVELLFEDGLVVELPDGQLLGGLEVELPFGVVVLGRLRVPLSQSHGPGSLLAESAWAGKRGPGWVAIAS